MSSRDERICCVNPLLNNEVSINRVGCARRNSSVSGSEYPGPVKSFSISSIVVEMHYLVLDVEVEFPSEKSTQVLVDKVVKCVAGGVLG